MSYRRSTFIWSLWFVAKGKDYPFLQKCKASTNQIIAIKRLFRLPTNHPMFDCVSLLVHLSPTYSPLSRTAFVWIEVKRSAVEWNRTCHPGGHYQLYYTVTRGPLARYIKLRVAHAPGMPGTSSSTPWVSDLDMHHDTCVTHVPCCLPGSLTNGFLWSRWWGKYSRYSWRMRNPQFYISGKRPIHLVKSLLRIGKLSTPRFHHRVQIFKCL